MSQKPLIEHLTDFLDYLEIEKGLSSKTQENYARFLNKFFNWLTALKLDKMPPQKLTAEHVWKYKVFLSRHIDPRTRESLKKSTQNYYLIALRSFLEYFVERKISSLSPSTVKLARDKSGKQVKFLPLGDLEKLLLAPDVTTAPGIRDRAILETLFSTGLRVAELTALNREQFKITKQTADLELSVIGKGKRVRTVYFSERAVTWLKKLLESRTDTETALFINVRPGADSNTRDRRLTTRSIEDIVKKYAKIAGLSIHPTPHTLRHSFATDLLAGGVDLRLVQEFLGHQNIATTQIYTHVTNKQLKDVHRRVHGGRKMKE